MRKRLQELGMTPNRFTELVIEARLAGVTGDVARDTARSTAQRNAKRWLSKKQEPRQLRLQTPNRELVARLLQVHPADLVDRRPPPLEARLEAVEARLDALDENRARAGTAGDLSLGHLQELYERLDARVTALEPQAEESNLGNGK